MIPVGTAVGYLTLDYSEFSKELKSAINESTGLSGKFSDTLGKGLSTVGNQIAGVGKTLTAGVTVPIGAAAASSIKFGAEFDKQMSNVQAVSNATSEELNSMRDAAIDWGEKTVYTASETADALYYMGLAGWEPQKSIAALGSVLNLAAAGNLDLGRSSDIVTDAMTAMNYEAGKYTNGIENSVYFTNSLAAAMSNSNTDVDQLGEAFKYVSPLAGALNMDINDLTLGLGLMANVGVKGTQAGTGFRQALKNLIAPTDDAQAAMDRYGISLFDVSGKAKNMRTFMEELRGTFGTLSLDIYDANGELKTGEQIMQEYGHALPVTQQEQLNAIVEIFGTRALPGVLGIINQSDEKFYNLANAIDNSNEAFVVHNGTVYTMADALAQFGEQAVSAGEDFEILGAAEGMALMQMDNLKGDWIRFTSALGTTKIIITDLVKNSLRGFVQRLTELVRWFNSLDESQQKFILKIIALIAVIGPVLLIIGRILSGIGGLIMGFNSLMKALNLIKVGVVMLTNVIKPLFALIAANPITLIIAGIVALVGAFIYLWNNCEAFRQFWINLWNNIKEFAIVTWGVLSEFFIGIWEYIKAGAIFIWETISTFFITIWETIKNTFFAAVNTISTFLSNAWNTIKSVAETVWNAIVGFFSSIWNTIHTTFTTVVNAISSFLSSAWNAISSTTMAVWNAISSFFSSIWNAISNTVTTFVNAINNTITSVWNAIKTFITTTVNTIKTTVTNAFTAMWNGVKNTINGIRNTIVTGLNSAVSYIKGLASSAFSWGADIVNGIINGIKSAIGGLIDTVSGLASTISSYLHFSVPDVGPLSTFESWMPDFMKGLAQGIEANKYLVKNAITGLATDMVVKPKADVSDMQVSGTPSYGNGQYGIYQNIGNAISELKDVITSGTLSDNSDIVIPIYIGNEMLDSIVVKAIDRSNYRNGGR